MKISYNWLKSIIPIDLPASEVSKLLTDIGLEVEKQFSYSSIDGGLEVVSYGCSMSPETIKIETKLPFIL